MQAPPARRPAYRQQPGHDGPDPAERARRDHRRACQPAEGLPAREPSAHRGGRRSISAAPALRGGNRLGSAGHLLGRADRRWRCPHLRSHHAALALRGRLRRCARACCDAHTATRAHPCPDTHTAAHAYSDAACDAVDRRPCGSRTGNSNAAPASRRPRLHPPPRRTTPRHRSPRHRSRRPRSPRPVPPPRPRPRRSPPVLRDDRRGRMCRRCPRPTSQGCPRIRETRPRGGQWARLGCWPSLRGPARCSFGAAGTSEREDACLS